MSQSVNDGDGGADRPVSTSLEARSVSNVVPAGCGETLAMLDPLYMCHFLCTNLQIWVMTSSCAPLSMHVRTRTVVSSVVTYDPDMSKIKGCTNMFTCYKNHMSRCRTKSWAAIWSLLHIQSKIQFFHAIARGFLLFGVNWSRQALYYMSSWKRASLCAGQTVRLNDSLINDKETGRHGSYLWHKQRWTTNAIFTRHCCKSECEMTNFKIANIGNIGKKCIYTLLIAIIMAVSHCQAVLCTCFVWQIVAI